MGWAKEPCAVVNQLLYVHGAGLYGYDFDMRYHPKDGSTIKAAYAEQANHPNVQAPGGNRAALRNHFGRNPMVVPGVCPMQAVSQSTIQNPEQKNNDRPISTLESLVKEYKGHFGTDWREVFAQTVKPDYRDYELL
jgi:hypothetical protein